MQFRLVTIVLILSASMTAAGNFNQSGGARLRTVPTAGAVVAYGRYNFMATGENNTCAGIGAQSAKADSGPVQQASCKQPSSAWTLTGVSGQPGRYTIESQSQPAKLWSSPNGSSTLTARKHVASEDAREQWILLLVPGATDVYTIKNGATDQCVDANTATKGKGDVVLSTCDDRAALRWQAIKIGG